MVYRRKQYSEIRCDNHPPAANELSSFRCESVWGILGSWIARIHGAGAISPRARYRSYPWASETIALFSIRLQAMKCLSQLTLRWKRSIFGAIGIRRNLWDIAVWHEG